MASTLDEALLPLVAVHCFWAPRCPTVVREFDAQAAHDAMEAHYAAEHEQDINRVLGWVR